MPKGFYKRKSIPERFWGNVDKNGPVPEHVPHLGNCWVWTGGGRKAIGNRIPYGKFSINDKTTPTHRASFHIVNGRWPNPFALHKCDGGKIGCVRPDHLFEGSAADNVHDKFSKGREVIKRGIEHPNAKLNDDLVREIRIYHANDESPLTMAKRIGVSPRTIRDVTNGISWRHVK